MGWREDPISEKQSQFIRKIKETGIMKPFYGKTKGEAYDFISSYVLLVKANKRRPPMFTDETTEFIDEIYSGLLPDGS